VDSVLSVSIEDLASDGVALISPADPSFDVLARPLIGNRVSDVALRLKPMLTIVVNDSGRTIVSYSVVWEVAQAGRGPDWYWGHASFPNAVCRDVVPGRDQDGFASGNRRIHALDVVVHGWGDNDAYYDQFLPQFADRAQETVAGAIGLRIRLDAVIFEDGTLIGEDTNGTLRSQFAACLGAKQARYGALLDALDEGRSLDDAFEHSDRMLFMRDDWNELWSQQALADTRAWCERHSGRDVRAMIRETIRLDPFLIVGG